MPTVFSKENSLRNLLIGDTRKKVKEFPLIEVLSATVLAIVVYLLKVRS